MKTNHRLRILTGSIATIAAIASHAHAQTSGSWNVNANGNWSTSANWLGGNVADGATATAAFDFDITADRTITLDTNRTIGNLVFRDTAAGSNAFILAGTTTLTLDDGADKPTISVYPRASGIIARIDTVLAGTNGFELLAGTPGQLGQLGIAGNNTFTGVVTIGANTRLRVDHINNGLGAKDALGIDPSLAVNFTEVLNGGTLQIGTQAANTANFGSELIKVQGAGVDGSGAITNLNNGQNNALQQVQMTGDTTFGGTARWDIRTGTAGTGRLHQNGFTLTKTGTNQVSLVNVTVVGGGDIQINQGIFAIEGGSGVGGSGTIFINAGGNLNFWNNTTAIAGGLTRQIVANGGVINMGNSNGTATIPAPIELRANTIFNQSTDGGTLEQMVFTGVISDSGGAFGPVKNGTGQVQFNGNNTYTGALTVNAGILILNGANPTTATTTVNAGTLTLGATGTLGSNVVDVKSGGVFNTSAIPGGHTIPAGGTLFLGRTGAAANDIIGSVTLGAGANFEVGTSARNGGALPARTATVSGALTFNGGGSAYFDLSNSVTPGGGVNDLIAVGGNLTLNGTTTIHVTPVAGTLVAGNYTLMTYAGVLAGGAGNLALSGLPSATRQTYAFDTTSVPNSVLLAVTGAAASLKWLGNGSTNVWDVNTSALWDNGGSPDVFFNLDSVLFDDTGSNSPDINLSGTITAGLITVNAAQDYTLGGAGVLDGGSIVKSGAGALIITNSGHTYAGGVQINGGAVSVPVLNNAGAAGPLGVAPTIGLDGGTLILTGSSETSSRNLNLGTGGGTVTVANAATVVEMADVTGSGTLTLNGAGALGFGRNDAAFTFGTTVLGSGGLQLNPHRVAGSATAHNVDITPGVLAGFTGTLILGEAASGSWRARFDAGEFGGTTGVTVKNGAQFWPVATTVTGQTMNITGIGYIETNGTGIGAIRLEGSTISNSTINVVGAAKIGAHNGTGTLDNVTLRGGELTVNGSNSANNYTVIFTGTADDGVDPLDKLIVGGPGTSGNQQVLQVGNGVASGELGSVPIQLGSGSQPVTIRFMQGNDSVLTGDITAVGSNTSIHADTFPGTSTGKGLVFDGNNVSTLYLGVGTGNIVSGATAKLTLENGATISATNFFLGEQNGRTGIVDHVDADVTVSGQFRVGHWPNNVSQYTMSNGTLTLTATPTQFPFQTTVSETVGVIYLGIDGVGVFNQGAGTTVTTPSVVLDNRGNTATGTSTYNLNGGNLVLTSSHGVIQRNGTHAMNIDGGTITANTSTALDLNTLSVSGANPAIFNTNGNTITLYGPISGSTGMAILGGGTFQVNDRTGGALNTPGGGTGGGSLGFQPVGVDSGTTLVFNRSVNDTWHGPISGGGNFTKAGAGTLTLTANSTYSGATTINQGALVVNGLLNPASTVTINASGTLGGIGATGPVILNAAGAITPGSTTAPGNVGGLNLGSLTVNGGSFNVDLDAGGPSNDLITVAGTANFIGASNFVVTINGSLAAGSYPVLTAGTLNVTTAPTASSSGGLSRYALGIDHTSTANTILLTVSGGPANLLWTGATNSDWDLNVTQNWDNAGSPDVFLNFDNAIFADGPVNRNIAIAAAGVNPSGILVNNSAGIDYSFNGPGALMGGTTITKDGGGTLTINNSNNHSGATTINGGVLKLGTGVNPLGVNTSVTVTDGGTLDVNGINGNAPNTRLNVTIEGSGAPGLAAIWNGGAGVTNNPLYSTITLSGDATIGGLNRYDLNGGPGGVTFNGGTFTLTKVGPNEAWWSPNAGATVGNIVVDGGTFGVQSSGNLGDDSGAYFIVVNPSGSLVTYNFQTNSKPIALNGGLLAANFQTGTWTNSVFLQGAGTSNRIGTIGGVGVTLEGQLTGANGFEKVGPGVLTLSNPTNDWAGHTRVSAGTLLLSGLGILSPATTLDMNGGTVDLNFTNQSIAGLQGAAGTIQGDSLLTVNQSANTAYSGNIAGATALTKEGTGLLALNGIIGTVGATNVNNGTLEVNGSLLGSIITVNSSGVLSGTGTVGTVNVTGGTVAPGASPGTLTTGNFSLDPTSVLDFELAMAGVAGSGINDLIVVNANLTLDGTLSITELPGFTEGTYRLFNYAGTLNDNTLDIDPAFLTSWPGSFVDTTTINQVNLVVVPEPSSTLILLGGIGTILSLRRSRRRA